MEEIIVPSLFGIILALTIILIYLVVENEIKFKIRDFISITKEEYIERDNEISPIDLANILGRFILNEDEISRRNANVLISLGLLKEDKKGRFYFVDVNEDSIRRLKEALKIINFQKELVKKDEFVEIEQNILMEIDIRNIIVLVIENMIKVKFFTFPTKFTIEIYRNKDLKKNMFILSESSRRVLLEDGTILAIRRIEKKFEKEGEQHKMIIILLGEIAKESEKVDTFLDELARELKELKNLKKEEFVRAIKRARRKI